MQGISESAILFVVSAPSGAGKTSLLRELVPSDPRLVISVSHATRAMRIGEKDGVHYHFVSTADFEALVEQGAFLEYAKVFDHYYGTSEDAVRMQLAQGLDVVLEIDWQGARQVRQRFPDAVSIFIAPPSIEALRERLSKRGQDSAEVVERRMVDARNELSHYLEYDYLVMNDDFGTALAELRAIVAAERLRQPRQKARFDAVLAKMLG
jgi:guanylate kinase